MELWYMPCMLSDVILPSTPTVASTLSALSAKLDTFKRLQAADVRAYDEVCLQETQTKSRTALLWGDPPRLQRAAICSFASEVISGVYLITLVCCQSPHSVQPVLDRRWYPRARGRGRDAGLKTLRTQSGQSRIRWLRRCLIETQQAVTRC